MGLMTFVTSGKLSATILVVTTDDSQKFSQNGMAGKKWWATWSLLICDRDEQWKNQSSFQHLYQHYEGRNDQPIQITGDRRWRVHLERKSIDP
jgi:hypothetical protein